MRRWFSSGVCLCVVACATSGGHKMAWPESRPTPLAAGGALEAEPAPALPVARLAPPITRKVHHPAMPSTRPTTLVLQWPLPATGVNSLYGHRTDPLDGTKRFHGGVDLEAEYGAVVQAAADGFVTEADWYAGHGRRVVIEHDGGYATVYSHLSQVLVVPGTWIKAGHAVGRVGNSGRSTGPHLHLETSRWGQSLDPLDLLGMPLALE